MNDTTNPPPAALDPRVRQALAAKVEGWERTEV